MEFWNRQLSAILSGRSPANVRRFTIWGLHRFEYSGRAVRKAAKPRADRIGWAVAHLSFSSSTCSSHPACPSKDGFDRRVDRLDHAEAHGVIAVRGDALDMTEEELAEAIHLRQALPTKRVDPAVQEIQHAGSSLVGPQPIELLPQHVRFEQATIRGEQGLEFSTLRPADGLPASQQQPAFAATVLAHDRARPKEFLASHLVERGAGVLQVSEND